MPNAIYPKYKEALYTRPSDSDMVAGVVKCALVDTASYSYSASHEFFSSVSGVVGTPLTITSKTFINGVFDGDNLFFTNVTGPTVESLVFYIDTGVAATSRLIAYIDTDVTNLPVIPNGGDINIAWNALGIFAL
jgi:hypothetical protein